MLPSQITKGGGSSYDEKIDEIITKYYNIL
jgi:hypothetical protein